MMEQKMMEQKMIDYLQFLMDEYQDAVKNKYETFKEYYWDAFRACKIMTESVTGKKVTFKNWKVVIEEE